MSKMHLTNEQVRPRLVPVADQLVLERRNPPTDVHVGDSLNKERPFLNAEAVHLALSLVLLRQQ